LLCLSAGVKVKKVPMVVVVGCSNTHPNADRVRFLKPIQLCSKNRCQKSYQGSIVVHKSRSIDKTNMVDGWVTMRTLACALSSSSFAQNHFKNEKRIHKKRDPCSLNRRRLSSSFAN
jgi:hypothetical protein